jgi:hypothetical protein
MWLSPGMSEAWRWTITTAAIFFTMGCQGRPTIAVVVGSNDDPSVVAVSRTLFFGEGTGSEETETDGQVNDRALSLAQLADQPKLVFSEFRDRGYEQFYIDRNWDDHAKMGLEQNTVLYIVGHGDPDNIQVGAGQRVRIKTISLGDQFTRYLFLIGCNILAHGPKRRCSEPTGLCGLDFSCPGAFHQDPPSGAMPTAHCRQNAFKRLAGESKRFPVLNPRMRVICGSSTQIPSNPSVALPILYYQYIERMGVTEAFLSGLAQVGTPICMSRGPENPTFSPLFDRDFVVDANRYQDYIYLQYFEDISGLTAMDFALDRLTTAITGTDPIPEVKRVDRIPLELPVIYLGPLVTVPLPREKGKGQGFGFRNFDLPDFIAPLDGSAYPLSSASLRVQSFTGGILEESTAAGGESIGALISKIRKRNEDKAVDLPSIPDRGGGVLPRFVFQRSKSQVLVVDRIDQSEAEAEMPSSLTKFIRCFHASSELAIELPSKFPGVTKTVIPVAGIGAGARYRVCPQSSAGRSAADRYSGVFVGDNTSRISVAARTVRYQEPEESISANEALELLKDEYGRRLDRYSIGEPNLVYYLEPIHCWQERLLAYWVFPLVPREGFEELPAVTPEVLAYRNQSIEEGSLSCSG